MTINIKTCTYFRGDIALYNMEVCTTPGIGIHLVGMPDAQCKESLLRVVTALQSLGYHIPGKKITIRVEKAVPVRVADGMRYREVCSAFDLAMALGILITSGQVPAPANMEAWENSLFFGSLSLAGEVRLPWCGHLGDWAGIPAAVVETLDWQLRATFDTIYAPACSAENTKITTGVSWLEELTSALKEGRI